MKSPKWWMVLLVLILFAPFLLQPGTVLFSPHSDFIADHFTARYLFSQSLRQDHTLPLWDAFRFGGSPLLGDWQCQWFYPLTWLYALVSPQQTLRLLGFQIALHLVLGGLGMYHYLRGQRLSPQASLLGALIFAFNGKWLAHLLAAQHPITGWAWLPWVMASMDRLRHKPGPAETARLACLVALLLLGSIPAFMAICAYFLTAYGLFLVLACRQRVALAACGGAAALWAGGLCWISLAPALEYLKVCTRGSALTLEQASQGQIPWKILAFLPAWPTSPLSIGWEMTLYAGTLACSLALLGLTRRPRQEEFFFQAVVLLVLLLALGSQTPLFGWCYRFLPGFASFRYPARFGLLLGVALSYLAARQFDQPRPLPTRALGALALAGLILAGAGQSQFGRAEGWFSFGVLLGMIVLSRLGPVWQGRGLLMLLALESGLFAHGLIDPRPIAQVLPPHILAEQMRRPVGEGRVLVTESQMLSAPYALLNSVESTHGSTALVPRVIMDYLLQGVCSSRPDPRAVLTGIPSLKPVSEGFLRRGQVDRVVSLQPLELSWPEQRTQPFRCFDFLAESGFLEMPALRLYSDPNPLPRHRLIGQAVAFSSQEQALEAARRLDPTRAVALESSLTQPAGPQSAEVQWRQLNDHTRELEVKGVQSPGAYLVISELYYPGWHLRSAQKLLQLERADAFFLAAYLTPGDHKLWLEYSPSEFPRAVKISSLLLLLALLTQVISRATNK